MCVPCAYVCVTSRGRRWRQRQQGAAVAAEDDWAVSPVGGWRRGGWERAGGRRRDRCHDPRGECHVPTSPSV